MDLSREQVARLANEADGREADAVRVEEQHDGSVVATLDDQTFRLARDGEIEPVTARRPLTTPDPPAPLIDHLARLARIALTDPAGLPEEEREYGGRHATGARLESTAAAISYAVDRMDEIIGTLSPEEWTPEHTARALSALGVQLANWTDAAAVVEAAGAAEALSTALDHIDAAISALKPEPDDEPEHEPEQTLTLVLIDRDPDHAPEGDFAHVEGITLEQLTDPLALGHLADGLADAFRGIVERDS